MTDWTWQQESIKAGYSACVAILTLLVGYLVGNRLTSMWAFRQKRRELDLLAASELYRLYGEFFAVWKLWNHLLGDSSCGAGDDVRWALTQRAALVDGGFEALLVRVTSERELTNPQQDDLGLLRQGFQCLRETIRDNTPLPWASSDHPEYLKFKELACGFSNLLSGSHDWAQPKPAKASETLKYITSNTHEDRWSTLTLPTKRGAA